MPTTDALWMSNNDGMAAVALSPLAAAPSRLRLSDDGAVIGLVDGAFLRLAESAAEGIRRIARAAGTISVFEVDKLGTVRRATTVAVDA